uniref:2Fe-2S ferredoxin-type domain-containing protein n=1 Tax=Timema shepardi TaxID=629360 RepID=A0A7R9G877_TIMSH|nr:unnamed protein product [Timema shepardi]
MCDLFCFRWGSEENKEGDGSNKTVEIRTKNETTFTINDVSYSVAAEVPVETNLNTFIRDYAHLSGTKFMCEEGGCGSCIVYVKRKHPTTGAETTGVVNSVSSP